MWKCINSQLDGDSDISLSAEILEYYLYIKDDFKNDEKGK